MSVKLPDGIKIMGIKVFENCPNLKTVTIGKETKILTQDKEIMNISYEFSHKNDYYAATAMIRNKAGAPNGLDWADYNTNTILIGGNRQHTDLICEICKQYEGIEKLNFPLGTITNVIN